MTDLSTSCDTLFQELLLFSKCYSGFPKLWDTYLQSPKSQQLVLLLRSDGTEVNPSPIFSGTEWLRIVDLEKPIALFADEDGYVSSTKVLESLTVYLSGLDDYQTADLELATVTIRLVLKSLPNDIFSLMVAVPVNNETGELSCYLLPDGAGNWRRMPTNFITQI